MERSQTILTDRQILRIVIAGCGRSGTHYFADLLNASSIAFEHEDAYTVFGRVKATRPDADSSWFAAPFLLASPRPEQVIHLVRNPVKVVQSFHRIGICANSIWSQFLFGRSVPDFILRSNIRLGFCWRRYRYVRVHRILLQNHTSCMDKEREVDRLWRYWYQWNRLIEKAGTLLGANYLRIRLEDLDNSLQSIRDFLEADGDFMPCAPTNQKNVYQARQIEWTSMPSEVHNLAAKYGYRDSELTLT